MAASAEPSVSGLTGRSKSTLSKLVATTGHDAALKSLRRDAFLVGVQGMLFSHAAMAVAAIGAIVVAGSRPTMVTGAGVAGVTIWLAGWFLWARGRSEVGWAPVPFVLLTSLGIGTLMTIAVGIPNPGIVFVPAMVVIAGTSLGRWCALGSVLGCLALAAAGIAFEGVLFAENATCPSWLANAECAVFRDVWMSLIGLVAAGMVTGLLATSVHDQVATAAALAFQRADELQRKLDAERSARQGKASADDVLSEALPIGVARFDISGNVNHTNDRFGELVRLALPDLPELANLELLAHRVPGLRDAVEEASGEPFEVSFGPDGEEGMLAFKVIQAGIGASAPTERILIVEDRSTDLRLEQLSDDAQRLGDEFASELGNSVSVAGVMAAMLKETLPEGNADSKAMSVVVEACKRAARATAGLVRRSLGGDEATALYVHTYDPSHGTEPLAAGSAHLRPRSAFVVQDDPGLATLIRRVLERGGYGVEISSSGREACKRLKDLEGLGLLVVNQELKGLEGARVAELARIRFPNVGIVSTCAKAADTEWAGLNKDDAPCLVLYKPFALEEIVGALARIGTTPRRKAAKAG